MPKGTDTSQHPGRKVGRDRYTTAGGSHNNFAAALDARDRDYAEADTRSRLEDEYGGGAGDWDH